MKIEHHKQLNEQQIKAINIIKDIETYVFQEILVAYDLIGHSEIDGRWKSIGKTHIQEAFMAFIRSVARPDEPNF